MPRDVDAFRPAADFGLSYIEQSLVSSIPHFLLLRKNHVCSNNALSTLEVFVSLWDNGVVEDAWSRGHVVACRSAIPPLAAARLPIMPMCCKFRLSSHHVQPNHDAGRKVRGLGPRVPKEGRECYMDQPPAISTKAQVAASLLGRV